MWKKVPLEVKMEALKLLQSGESFQSVSKLLHINDGELKTWSLIYEKEGEKGLASHPKNVCTGKIKDKIICTYRQKRVPLHTLSAKYHVPYSSVASCISTYRRKGNAGVEGAVIDMMEVMRSGDTLEEALTKAELKNKLKVALNENEYLRAEVAYLKKLKALMEADEKRKRNGSKPSSH
jgi:transposase